MIRIAVLASGSGSNLQALLDACAAGAIDGEACVVLSNVPTARALERANARSVPTEVLPSKGRSDREQYDAEVVERLAAHRPDLVCLAGWMRLLTPVFLRAFAATPQTRGCPRVMNIHPGLLPSFPGLQGPRQAIEYGARIAGCTVHFVDEGCDTGPVIVQAAVPVLGSDTEETLAARILQQEHRLYPRAVQWFAQGRLGVEGRRVRLDGERVPAVAALVQPWEP